MSDERGTEVVRREDVDEELPAEVQDRTKLPTGMLEPVAQPSEVVKARTERSEMIADALEEGRDYGSVQGIPKPFLHKPGAERLTDAFGCYPRFRILDQEVDHDRRVEWEKRSGKSGTSRGLYRYVVSCDLIHRASGIVVGNGLGACSTMEDKYVDSPRNAENTCLKMGKKRAHVDAALSTFGLSGMFTQDADYAKQDPSGESGDEGSSLRCPDCGGPIWDNTDDDKAAVNGGKRPNFKCRDREGCNWASWESEEKAFGIDLEGPSEAEMDAALGQLEARLDELADAGKADYADRVEARIAEHRENGTLTMEVLDKAIAAAEQAMPAPEPESEAESGEGEGASAEEKVREWFEAEHPKAWKAELQAFGFDHPALDTEYDGWSEAQWTLAWHGYRKHGAAFFDTPSEFVDEEQAEMEVAG